MTEQTTHEPDPLHPQPLLVDAKGAAKLMSVSERFIWGLANEGILPRVRLGRRVLFDPDDLREWIRRNKEPGSFTRPAGRVE